MYAREKYPRRAQVGVPPPPLIKGVLNRGMRRGEYAPEKDPPCIVHTHAPTPTQSEITHSEKNILTLCSEIHIVPLTNTQVTEGWGSCSSPCVIKNAKPPKKKEIHEFTTTPSNARHE